MRRRNEHILIVGTGFAGIGMAIRLKQAGIDDFTLLEQASGVGGTWRDNHYPGAACDVESHLYSFSFEPNPEWSRTYAPQREILAYLEHCVDKYDLRRHLRLETAVERASYDDERGLWTVETSTGESIEARALVLGCGGLSRPAYPDIPGLQDFEGEMFHSARWNHAASLDGKRVGVIGTGASAIQIVPSVAPVAGKLSLFQRTAPWILSKNDRPISEAKRARFRRFPALQKLARLGQYARHELYATGFVVEPRILKAAERLAHRHIKRSVRDPELRRKVTPHFHMGCKRVLLSNDYYPALCRDNVDVVTDGIERVEARGVRTKDGTLHELDALVLATGFQAAEVGSPFEVRGKGGRDLAETWKPGAEAYLGTTVAGFPNLFIIVGPNTGLGHSSMVLMIEAQIRYIMGALDVLRARGLKSLDVRAEVQDAYNARIQQRLAGTVWNSGCVSWYMTASGKNTTLWPGYTLEFMARTRRFDAASYALEPERARDFRRVPRRRRVLQRASL
jgi:cation diffusion facilitator CzcD-associated flavoprotein CzcO